MSSFCAGVSFCISNREKWLSASSKDVSSSLACSQRWSECLPQGPSVFTVAEVVVDFLAY